MNNWSESSILLVRESSSRYYNEPNVSMLGDDAGLYSDLVESTDGSNKDNGVGRVEVRLDTRHPSGREMAEKYE